MTRVKYNSDQWTQARFNSFIKSSLRTASVRWPPRYEALNDAFVGKKTNEKTGRLAKHFECNKCHGEFPQKEVEVNHIIAVVPVEGFDNWTNVIDRLFCEKSGLEVLCKPCHKEVTQEENQERKKYK